MIVGGGAAADGVITGLREAGSDGSIVLLTAEAMPPYERPPLSKAYLLGHEDRSRLLFKSREALEDVGVDLHVGSPVLELDLAGRQVRTESATFVYDRLVLAMGARARRLEAVPEALTLRTAADADGLREAMKSAGRLSVVGAGFIGCEVAAAATALGCRVTMLEALDAPLERVLGPEVGEFVAQLQRSHGVELRTGVRELPELETPVLAGVGSEPNIELAMQAGLAVDRGVLVDEFGATGADGVFAAGDVARFHSPLYGEHVRVEHFQTAWRQGRSVGLNVGGRPSAFTEAPWFWSDQFDVNLQYVGAGVAWDSTVVRGRLGQPPFSVFYLRSGELVAAAGVDDGRTVSRARRLLEARVPVSAAELEDPAVDLRALARRSR